MLRTTMTFSVVFLVCEQKYKCDKAASIEKSDSKWSTDSTSKTDVKCVSAKIEGFAPVLNLFTSRKNVTLANPCPPPRCPCPVCFSCTICPLLLS